jgi:hypothetical protein
MANIVLNFQFALSLLPILFILIKIRDKKIDIKTIITFGLLTFVNMGLKFYGGVITIMLICSYLLFDHFFKNKRQTLIYLSIIILFFIASIFIFYDPLSSLKTGSIFIFSPFAMIHSVTEDPSLLHFERLTNARYFYQSKGFNFHLIFIESFNLLAFLFFYLGVRFFGLLYVGIQILRKKIQAFDLSIIATVVISIIFTTFFVQKGEWTNIIQFFYYGSFLLTLYLTELTYRFIKTKSILGYLVVIIFMTLAVPATIDTAKLYATFPGTTYLPEGEMEVLQVLKKLPNGIVYSPLYNEGEKNQNVIKELKEKNLPLPLYAWNDTAYVTAFSGKQHYLADLWMERITGINYQDRLDKVLKNDCSFLKEINYIYSNNDYQLDRQLFDCPNRLKLIYGNRTATIYSVIK